MFGYYVALARTRLLETKGMSAALILALGLGIGASMTMLTVVRTMTWDPLPGRSEHLYHPFIDALPTSYDVKPGKDPRVALTWVDAQNLLRQAPASHQTALASARLLVDAQRSVQIPFFTQGQYVTADAFAMFGIPVAQGRAWTREDDAAHARVVVLSQELAARLGSEGLVGAAVRLGGQAFTVVGIAGPWSPRPRFYTDLQRDVFKGREDFFIPIGVAAEMQMTVSNSVFSWSGDKPLNRLQDARTSWIQFWAELPDAASVEQYERFLGNYARAQHQAGRFERATAPRMVSLKDFLVEHRIIPNEVKLQLALCLGFLIVCLLNMSALIFARFIRRSHEISVRRALGARRQDVIYQLCTEALIIGGLGGAVGLIVAEAGLYLVRMQPEDYASLANMDLSMAVLTVGLACVSSVIAAFFPALRATSGRLAMQIKASE